MYDDDNDDDILIIDEDDIRNGSVMVRRGRGNDHRAQGGGGGVRPASRRHYLPPPSNYNYPHHTKPHAVAVVQPVVAQPVAQPASELTAAAKWIPDVLRGIAAIMPMPIPPNADDDIGDNVKNLITYFGALAQTAQRKEQLHTLATIAARHLP